MSKNIFSQRMPLYYTQFRAAKDDFGRYLASINSASLNPSQKRFCRKGKDKPSALSNLVDAEVQYLQEKRNYDRNWYRVEKEKASDAVLRELKGWKTTPM